MSTPHTIDMPGTSGKFRSRNPIGFQTSIDSKNFSMYNPYSGLLLPDTRIPLQFFLHRNMGDMGNADNSHKSSEKTQTSYSFLYQKARQGERVSRQLSECWNRNDDHTTNENFEKLQQSFMKRNEDNGEPDLVLKNPFALHYTIYPWMERTNRNVRDGGTYYTLLLNCWNKFKMALI